MKTAFESIKRGLQEAIEHAERYKPVPLDAHAFAEDACQRDPGFREAYEGMADEFASLKARVLANPEARAEYDAQTPEFDQERERITRRKAPD